MIESIVASKISSINSLAIPLNSKRCFIIISDSQRIEMTYRVLRGGVKGIVWYFICPQTGRKCLKLHLYQGLYVHSSQIKGFARLNKPPWFSNTSINKILVIKQGEIDARKLMKQKYFKKFYNNKPTKAYIKCTSLINLGSRYSIFGIINGEYDNSMTQFDK